MRFTVNGANRVTGKPMALTVEAESEEHAAAEANECGVLVSALRPAGAPVPPPPARSRFAPLPPDYFWLKVWAWVLMVVGGLTLGAAALAAIAVVAGKAGPRMDEVDLAVILVGWAALFIVAAIGAILRAGAQVLFAFRDIARNSWALKG